MDQPFFQMSGKTSLFAVLCFTTQGSKGYVSQRGELIQTRSVMPHTMCLPVLTQEVYPNPETFDPERFLKDGSLDKSVCDPTNFTFGFGRRCLHCFVITTYRF
jgi:hypothetical protein